MTTKHIPDSHVRVKRLQLDLVSRQLAISPPKQLFIRGPIPLSWLAVAAKLPGKTIHVALALWWLYGMSNGAPLKMTRQALVALNVERDAERAGLIRLESAGLIRVARRPGQRPLVTILAAPPR